jgi:hypothetical protein
MAYRDVSESLRAYRDRIVHDLEEARRAAREAADQAARVSVLEKELIETEGLLAKVSGNRPGLPLLDDVTIAAPCKASWEQMVGDDHVRFCGQCDKNVYNLSSLPREEAEALLVAREGKMCVRLFKRDDGTVLTSDCPVGVKTRRRRRATLAAVGGGLMAAAAALGMEGSGRRATMGAMPLTMGSVAVPVATASVTVPVATSAAPITVAPDPVPATTAAPRQRSWSVGTAVAPPRRPLPLMGAPAIGRTAQ